VSPVIRVVINYPDITWSGGYGFNVIGMMAEARKINGT